MIFFNSLTFVPHRSKREHHLHCRFAVGTGEVSITNGSFIHDGDEKRPYEMMLPNGEVHDHLDVDAVNGLLIALQK